MRWLLPFLLFLWPTASYGETIVFHVLPPLSVQGDVACVDLAGAKLLLTYDAELLGLREVRVALESALESARGAVADLKQAAVSDAKGIKVLQDENDRLNGEIMKKVAEYNALQAKASKPSWGWVVAAGVGVVAIGLAIALGAYAYMTR